jgi:hypothetical protein
MGALANQAIALEIMTVAALGEAILPQAPADGGFKVAAPLSHEETIYRPECPASETSGSFSCRLAGVSGG